MRLRLSEVKKLQKILKERGARSVAEDRDPVRAANVESDIGRVTQKSDDLVEVRPPMRIVVHTFRCNPADSDGISSKWWTDAALEKWGLPNDGRSYIVETLYRETFVSKRDEEQTVIELQTVTDMSCYEWTRKGWSYKDPR